MENERPGFDESDRLEAEALDQSVDLSGRPVPKGVRVVIESGLEVPCDVRYDGRDEDGYRRYVVDAHTDWSKHVVSVLAVEEMPIDARLIIDMGDATDAEAERATANLRVEVAASV